MEEQELLRELRRTAESGRITIGLRTTRKALRRGELRLIIAASNCPDEELISKEEIEGVKVIRVSRRNTDLGAFIGKPFPVSVVGIVDPGNSKILQVAGVS